MKRPLHILIVEDNPDDADLMLSELRRAGFDPQWKRVETEADFLTEIKNSPDIILCDYSMPEFNGLQAAELLRKNGLDIPFILISGVVGEEVAVDAMRRGVTDYLLKDRLARLGQAIERALEQRRLREERKQTVEELRKLSSIVQNMANIVESSNDAIIGESLEGIITSWNPAAEKIFGYSAAEIIGRSVTLLMPPDRAAEESVILDRIARGEDIVHIETRRMRKDGAQIDLAETLSPIRDAGGKIVGASKIGRDITARTTPEPPPRQGDAKCRQMAETIADVFYITSPDQQQMHYVSPAYEIIWGRSAAKLYAHPQEWAEAILPEDRERVWKTFSRLAADESSASAEFQISRPDGEMRWILSRGFQVRDPAGKVIRITGVASDITERKRNEEELRESERRFSDMLRNLELVSMMLDRDARITYCNDYMLRLTGWQREEVIGGDWFELFLPPEIVGDLRGVSSALLDNQPAAWHYENEIVTRSGARRLIRWNNSILRSASGDVTGTASIGEDITERKLAEAELEQTHKQLVEASRQAGMAEFATGVLHNVGNVLNSVAVASTCMSDSLKKSKSADLARVVALMRQHEADLGAFFTLDPKGKQIPGFLALLAERLAAEHATALKEMGGLQKNVEHIKGIISVQQDSAKMSRSPEALKLTDLIEDALKMNANGLGRGGIQVRKDFEEVPPIMMEKHKVLQILVNLVRNATQACEASGGPEKRLTLRVSQAAGRACIAVTDNGSGILPENLSRIFAQGFTTKKDGHGFGLHGAARAAEEMGGSLAVQSEGSGRGATFTLELPMKG